MTEEKRQINEIGIALTKCTQGYNLYWCKNEKRIGWMEGINECNE